MKGNKVKSLDDLLVELADARSRRDKLRKYIRTANLDRYHRYLCNQSVRLIRRTIKRLKKEIENAL